MHCHEDRTTTKVAPKLKLQMINIPNRNDSSLKCNPVISKDRIFFFFFPLSIFDFYRMKQ